MNISVTESPVFCPRCENTIPEVGADHRCLTDEELALWNRIEATLKTTIKDLTEGVE